MDTSEFSALQSCDTLAESEDSWIVLLCLWAPCVFSGHWLVYDVQWVFWRREKAAPLSTAKRCCELHQSFAVIDNLFYVTIPIISVHSRTTKLFLDYSESITARCVCVIVPHTPCLWCWQLLERAVLDLGLFLDLNHIALVAETETKVGAEVTARLWSD